MAVELFLWIFLAAFGCLGGSIIVIETLADERAVRENTRLRRLTLHRATLIAVARTRTRTEIIRLSVHIIFLVIGLTSLSGEWIGRDVTRQVIAWGLITASATLILASSYDCVERKRQSYLFSREGGSSPR